MKNAREKELVEKIAKRYGLTVLILFGSHALGSAHKKSDFDIAYISARSLTLHEESELILDLSSVVKSEHIDLLNLRTSPPLLFYAALKDGKPLYEKEPLVFTSLRAYAFKKYVETKPLYEERFKRLQKEIARL